jgi:Arc/MetJ family transcription regulator
LYITTHMCIIWCMRTNIELNDELLAQARKYSRARTKKRLVEEALETFVTVRAEEARRRTYKERLERVRDLTRNSRRRSDAHEILRRDRDTR